MKIIKYFSYLLLSASFIFTSCDVPQNPDAANYGTARTPSSSSDPFFNNQSPTPSTPSTTNTTDTTSSIDIPDDVSHCLWSDGNNSNFMYSSQHLSETDSRSMSFSVCQSRATDSVVYFQIEQPVRDVQICFIPMNQQGSSSTYIGEPRCLNATDNKKIYRIQMFKSRQGFENMAINSVMIIKDKMYPFGFPYAPNLYSTRSILSPDAFLICNQSLTHPVYPNPEYCNTFIAQKHYHFQRF